VSGAHGGDRREPVTQPGNCHRIALAVADLDAATQWFQEMLGAVTMPVKEQLDVDRIVLENDGALLSILWLKNVPIVLLGSSDPNGNVGRFLVSNGPGVQSLAWEIPDMWRTENLLRAAGVRIVGTDIPGRHFFMHPRDSEGLLLEYTDDKLPGDPRLGAPPIDAQGAVPVRAVAAVTAVVDDLDAAVECLRYSFDAVVEPGGDSKSGDDETVDTRIGDMTLRLVKPLRDASVYAGRQGNNRYRSMVLAVDSLDQLVGRLKELGIRVARSGATSVWTEPADTLGLQLQFVEEMGEP
jgi:catechol 2,3-dioxygenase-like lactoylglutathione lyase family enzyme